MEIICSIIRELLREHSLALAVKRFNARISVVILENPGNATEIFCQDTHLICE